MNRASAMIGSFYFFYFSVIGISVVFFPKLLFDHGYTPHQIGIIYAILPLVRFLSPFIFSRWLPMTSTIYKIALILTFIGTLAMALSIQSYLLLLGTTFLWSIAWTIMLPYVDAKALDTMSKQTYGRVRLFGSLGFISTTLLIGFITQSTFFELSLLVICAFFTALFGYALLDDHDKKTDALQTHVTHIAILTHWPFWLSMFLMQIAFAAYYNFFTIFASQHHYGNDLISSFWTIGVIAEILMLYFQGRFFHFSLQKLILAATLLTALRWMVVDLFIDNFILMIIVQTLHSVSFALYHTATIAYLFEIYPQKRVAQQFYYGISFGLGGFLGALLFGKIYGEHIFMVAGIMTLAASIIFWFGEHHIRQRSL